MYERDIMAIIDYTNEYLAVRNTSSLDSDFEANVHANSAARDILKRVLQESLNTPYFVSGTPQPDAMEIVQDYVDYMDELSEKTEDEKKSLIFSIARDTGLEILMVLQERRTDVC